MKTCLVLLACLLGAALARDYSGYKVLRITPRSDEQRQWLRDLEKEMGDKLDFWSGVKRLPGSTVDIMVPPRLRLDLTRTLSASHIPFTTMIDDVGDLIRGQELQRLERPPSSQAFADFDYSVYHSYDEIQQWVRDVVEAYPGITERFTLPSVSYEGREISGFKIRGTGGSAGTRPGVYFEGGIHAREWISPATVMYVMYKLLADYESGDATVVRLFDTMDWYIVPSLNVDGYVFTNTDRLWRKTRSSNVEETGSGCTGTDPNRNWPYKWGGSGTSANPCSNVYHGYAKLSEQEVEAVVDFLREKKNDGQDFVWFIDWHSYSQLIISPWSYSETVADPVDLPDIQAAGDAMTEAIFAQSGYTYTAGPTAKLLYEAAGASNDWGYAPYNSVSKLQGGLGAKYSYVVELRDEGQYGFLLPEDQIIPTGAENYEGIKAMGNFIMNTESL